MNSYQEDFARDTGKAQIVREGDRVLLCRPKQGRAAAVLHHPSFGLDENLLMLVRHLVVRRRSLEGYDAVTVAAVAGNEKLMDSMVEFPKDYRRNPPMKSVRLLMAERGLHGQLREEHELAWIQVHLERYYRVWTWDTGPVDGMSFGTRAEAIVARDRLNTSATDWSTITGPGPMR